MELVDHDNDSDNNSDPPGTSKKSPLQISSTNIEKEFANLRIKHLQGIERCQYHLQKYGRWVVWPIIVLFVLPTLTSVLFTLVLEPMGVLLPENYYFTLWMQSDLWSVWGFKDAPFAEKGASKVQKIGEKYFGEYCMVLLVWYSKPFLYWLCNWTDIDRSDARKNRQKLAWTRLNFSLNLLQENERGEPKITMRTINEDSLTVIFTGMLWHNDCFMPVNETLSRVECGGGVLLLLYCNCILLHCILVGFAHVGGSFGFHCCWAKTLILYTHR
jgi:hypothetical protein